jgi:hypothetical protein
MKNIKLLYVLLLAVTLGFTSCGDEEEPKPAAQSGFTQDRKIIETLEKVTFTNTSTNANRYEWDFGNGNTSVEANPSAIYYMPGTYTVKLTAYNSENVANTTTSVVKVGERYLTSIRINRLNFSTPSGGNWDFSDGPDLLFNLTKVGNTTWDHSFSIGSNITQSMVPKNYALATPLKLTNENWFFQLEDYDSPDPNDIMATWNTNPSSGGTKDYNLGLGSFDLTGTQLEIRMYFEIK